MWHALHPVSKRCASETDDSQTAYRQWFLVDIRKKHDILDWAWYVCLKTRHCSLCVVVFRMLQRYDDSEKEEFSRNQQKTSELLKQLRKEKGLTQEQPAENFYVSSRTVSRWETDFLCYLSRRVISCVTEVPSAGWLLFILKVINREPSVLLSTTSATST